MKNINEPIGLRAYAKFAERYAAAAPTKAHNALYERPATTALLGDVNGLRVLDAGCGPGICSEHLARNGATVHAFDITPAEAGVYVDGYYMGPVAQFTPNQPPLALAPGRHHVEIREPGFEIIAFDVDILPGQVIPYQGDLRRF